MKNVALAFGFLLLASGCRKDKLSNTLIGTWELRESAGGWTPLKQYAPGNGNLVVFDEKNQYTQKVVTADTSYTLVYKYSLLKENECGENLVVHTTGDDNGDFKKRAFTSHDTLTILDACIADGNSAVYVRQ